MVFVVVAAILGILYLLRGMPFFNNIWIIISAAYGAFLILLGNLKNFFEGRDSGTIGDLEERLDELNKIQKDLIETLMAERTVFREKLSRLEREEASLDSKIKEKEKRLEEYYDLETWEKNRWREKPGEKQQDSIPGPIGKERPLEDFHYTDM